MCRFTLGRVLAVTIGILTLAFSPASFAAEKEASGKSEKAEAGKKKPKSKPKSDAYPLWGEVVAITSRTLTIKGGEGKEDRKFTINAETRIHNDDKPAKLEDIKVGRRVGGYVQKMDEGNDRMLSINVGAAQEAKKKAPSKKSEGDGKVKKS